jgi:1,5-anhydro-D-fructose reductase (1,5-anhydro-D-mannitol-forming)
MVKSYIVQRRAFRWALIGASDVAATRIIPALRRLGHEPAVVMSSNLERANAYAHRHGVERATSSLAETVTNDIDAVYISTRNNLHAAQVRAVVAARRPVLCEKPLALSLYDAYEMVEAASAAGVVMGTNYHIRNAPVHRTARKLLIDGAVGRPLAVRVAHAVSLPERLRGWRITSAPGSGVVFDITVHDIDTIRFVVQLEPSEVAAVGFSQGMANGTLDAVAVSGRLGMDVTIQLHDAFTIAHARTGFEVHGTDGSIYITEAMTQEPDGEVVLVRAGKDDMLIKVSDREDLYERALRTFSAAVRGEGKPAATGEDGVQSLAVALAVQDSVLTGHRVLLTHNHPHR